MRYVKLGRANSQDEFLKTIEQMANLNEKGAEAALEFSRFMGLLEKGELEKAKLKCALVEEIRESKEEKEGEITGYFIIYTGRTGRRAEPSGRGKPKLFAALTLTRQGRPSVFLKGEKYDGDKDVWKNNLAEARERLQRGEPFDGQ